MIAVFPRVEEFYARRSKKRLLILYFSLLALYLAAEIFMIVFFIVRVNAAQDRSLQSLFEYLSISISVGFGWFSILFFSIKYKLTKKYVKMFDDFEKGLKDTEIGVFEGYDEEIKSKNDVEFYVMRVKCKPKDRRFDDAVREILVYKESPKLDISVGTQIKILTHSNILIAFEILTEEQKEQNNEKK